MRKIVNRNFCFIPSRAYFFQARWSSVLLFISLRILIASFQSWVTQKHFFFQDSVSRVVPIVMELGSCDFAYVRVHRRTGKHRVLEEEEIKRYAREGWIVVPVLSSCLKFNYFFLSVAKFEHALLWARFPRLPWRSRYDLLVLLVYTWRQGGHVGGEEQSLSLLWELNSIFM